MRYKVYQLAVEIDRINYLHLSNGTFEKLVSLIVDGLDTKINREELIAALEILRD